MAPEVWAVLVYLVLAPTFVKVFHLIGVIQAMKVGIITAIFPALVCYLLLSQ
jgi:hypothetical protein